MISIDTNTTLNRIISILKCKIDDIEWMIPAPSSKHWWLISVKNKQGALIHKIKGEQSIPYDPYKIIATIRQE